MNKSETIIQQVFLRDFEVICSIGVHKHEKKRPQKLLLNLELNVENIPSFGDKLEFAVCYEEIANKIRSIASRGHMNLIETFAERIVSCCEEDPRIKRIKIVIEKPGVIKGALSAGVTISRDINQN